jgi:hypothetical protein
VQPFYKQTKIKWNIGLKYFLYSGFSDTRGQRATGKVGTAGSTERDDQETERGESTGAGSEKARRADTETGRERYVSSEIKRGGGIVCTEINALFAF